MNCKKPAALTLEQMRQIARRVTYRQGWSVTVDECHSQGGVDVLWSGPIICSNTGLPGFIRSRDCVGALYSEEEFLERVIASAMKIELHEAREFFKIDGKRVYDPHSSLSEQPTIRVTNHAITLTEHLR